MYDAGVGRFTGVDPIAENFAFISSYNYAENTPINAIDLHGLQAYYVHGTGGSNSAWNSDPILVSSITAKMGNTSQYTNFSWNGNNNSADRTVAAHALVKNILNSREKGQPITIVGHSHGGSVGVIAVNILRNMNKLDDVEVNLVTLNTVYRSDYQLSEAASGSNTNHYNLYVPDDIVAGENAGFSLTGIIEMEGIGETTGKPGSPPDGTVKRKILGIFNREFYRSEKGRRMGGEAGSGLLTHPNALNIKVGSVNNFWSHFGGLGRTINAKKNHRLWWSKHGQSKKATDAINSIEK